jgi:Protein of unknown function (DUF1059)
VDLHRVPLHEAALEGEVPDGINVVRLDHREDDVVRAENAQRADVDAEVLGELRDLAGTLLQYLPRLSIGGRAEVGRVLGDEGECCHDVSVLLSVVEARVAAARFANLSSSFLSPGYDEGVKQIPCVCGYVVKGDDDDELWQQAQKHMREDHPDLAGKVSRADLLAQAEEVPKRKS